MLQLQIIHFNLSSQPSFNFAYYRESLEKWHSTSNSFITIGRCKRGRGSRGSKKVGPFLKYIKNPKTVYSPSKFFLQYFGPSPLPKYKNQMDILDFSTCIPLCLYRTLNFKNLI
jgi:hypothetical protein